MNNSFYSKKELEQIGFKSIGENVLISRKTSIYNPKAISIGSNVRIDDFCILSGGKEIILGSFVHIGGYSALYGGAGIELKDFSGISPRVSIFSVSDDYTGNSLSNPMIPLKYKPKFKSGFVEVGIHSIVGAHSVILPGVTLGEGATIGAHSLINKDCEPWCFYFGAPGRKLSKRSKNLLVLKKQFLEEFNNL